ncbi:MAG: hypothetical protein IPP07_25220 [Holophagales bacterium]|nr:hypothetical protein [Holophagales bacterium]
MRTVLRLASCLAVVLLAACGAAAPRAPPARHEERGLRLVDLRFAAQLTSPGHEPKFFDDAGCLRDWLKAPREEAPWTAWVTDHRTKEWVKAKDALFTRNPSVQTPMNSGLLAHANPASRDADPSAKAGMDVPAAEVIGPFPTEPK